jgi:hypothetical protein
MPETIAVAAGLSIAVNGAGATKVVRVVGACRTGRGERCNTHQDPLQTLLAHQFLPL